jgi:hypothetical protein
MVRWVKGLMKLPILKAAINMGLLRTHTTVRNNIKVERNSSRREYAIVISKERQSFTKGTEARGSNTKITTPTPNVRRRQSANIHQAVQGFPPLENGMVGKGLNEPPNSQCCNQCVIITHTHKGERQC